MLRQFSVKRLTSLIEAGFRYKQIATELGVDYHTARRWVRRAGLAYAYRKGDRSMPGPKELAELQAKAKAALAEEIRQAKDEAKTAPPYRGGY